MRPSASSLQGALLNRAWIQWAALGVDATVERDDAVVDPEALIALTAELGDADARLRDLSTDWCVAYGRYVNGSRLKQVARGTSSAVSGSAEKGTLSRIQGDPHGLTLDLPAVGLDSGVGVAES